MITRAHAIQARQIMMQEYLDLDVLDNQVGYVRVQNVETESLEGCTSSRITYTISHH